MFKKNVFFVLLHRVPIATGTMNILCCRRGAPQAHLGLTFPSNGYTIPKNSKKPFFKKRTFFFLNRFYFPCLFSNFITECPSPQAGGTYYAADAMRRRRTSAQRRRRAAPQARRSQQEEARGTSAHPQGRVTDVLMRAAGRQRAICEQSEAAGDR